MYYEQYSDKKVLVKLCVAYKHLQNHNCHTEDRENAKSDFGFGLLTFIQTPIRAGGIEGSEVSTQCESAQSWGGGVYAPLEP